MVAIQSGLGSIKTTQNYVVFEALWNLGSRSVSCLSGKQKSQQNTIEWHKNGKDTSREMWASTKELTNNNVSSAKQTTFHLREAE